MRRCVRHDIKWNMARAHCTNSVAIVYITYRQACPQGSMPVFRLLRGGIIRFSPPQGQCIAPINMKFGTDPLHVPNFTVMGAKNVAVQPQNRQIWNFVHKFAPQGRLVCTIFTKFTAFLHISRLLLLPVIRTLVWYGTNRAIFIALAG